jgi:thiol:disulfide interchange protein DsbD
VRKIAAALLALGALLGATDSPAQPASARTPQVGVELAPRTAGAAPGSVFHLALRQTIKPGWHTYWRNPGDSGEPTQIRWTLPPGWSAGEIIWPAPERQPIGPLVNYGYEDEVWLTTPIAVPASARPGETVTVRADAVWLVCEEICIPEQAALSIAVPIVAGAPSPHPRFGRPLARVLEEAPKPEGLKAAVQLQAGALKLAATGPQLRRADLADAYFYPYDGALIDHARPQRIERGPEGLTLTLAPGYGFEGGAGLTGPVAGVLAVGDDAFEITAAPGALLAGAAGLGPPAASARGGSGDGRGLPLAMGLALLGGLLLNLMPCVFPVLSLKAAALAGHAHEPRTARLHGLAFTAGVLATFAGLAVVLLAFRAAGQAAGWGFQLQNPAVVGALALVLFAVGLNLSGVFHVGGSLQNTGGALAGRGGAVGAFFTGALAVVVAAPCTAPFMAGAVGFALTQSPAAALAVFLALGLGLALPFLALSFSPGLLKRLPRPGAWMAGLQRVLAFPMYAAAAWLAWVLGRQTGPDGMSLLLGAAVLLAFALWLSKGDLSQARVRPIAIALAVAAALPVPFLVSAAAAQQPARTAAGDAEGLIPKEPWSPERVAALQAEGRPVFVNFTADWCVTCKLNERVALSSRRVADAFERNGVAYLEADWTARDDVIAGALAEHGRSGVPLYLLYRPGEPQPAILPQLLTPGALTGALERAGKS